MKTNVVEVENNQSFEYWLKKNWYYHYFVTRFYSFHIPESKRVLQIGCKTGTLLHAVKPSYAVGIEADSACLHTAQKKYPNIAFYDSLDAIREHNSTFDYIILSAVIHEVYDIAQLLNVLTQFCHERTRLIIDFYSWHWEPILYIGQKLGLRRKTPLINWISSADMIHFLYLAQFQPITTGKFLFLPYYIPIISYLFNMIIMQLPVLNRLCLMQWIIAQPKQIEKKKEEFTVSVIIPCRNEKGNIESAVLRCPEMGAKTELIFVEGHSSDKTFEEIERVARLYPEKSIHYCVQDGVGKGDAVRKGFSLATGDVLMILDADLTMPPEELPQFFYALIQGNGHCINGSRLVYGMESGAMRFLNMLANYFFAQLFSWLLGQSIKDTLCGTKVLFKKDYEAIAANRHYFGDFDPFGDFDLLFGAAKLHLKIIDLPIHYKARTYGSTQIRRFFHGLLLIRMSFIAFKKLKLLYDTELIK